MSFNSIVMRNIFYFYMKDFLQKNVLNMYYVLTICYNASIYCNVYNISQHKIKVQEASDVACTSQNKKEIMKILLQRPYRYNFVETK